MKIVEEYQVVKIEYLVDVDTKVAALKAAKSLGSDVVNLSNGPVYVKTQSYEVRDLTPKEKEDKVVKDAVNWWTDCDKDAMPELTPKKKERKVTTKTAKVAADNKKSNLIDEIFGDLL